MTDKGIILAVDDASDWLALLVEILTPAGYQVLTTESGEQALAVVAAHPPDLVLLDICMSAMDGLEVCRRLKAREETRHIPIVLTSAFADVKEWVAGLQLGAVDYIAKPFQAELLIARVKTHLFLSRTNAFLAQQTSALRQANEQLQAEIAEHQRAKEELRESMDGLTRAESFSHIMVTHMGLDGRWLKVPPPLCQLLGYTEAELLARRVQDTLLPENAELDWTQYQNLIHGDLKSCSSDKRFRCHDGRVLWLSVNTTLVTDAAGKPVHFLTYLRDTTEQVEAIEKIRAQAQLLDLAQDAILVRDLTGAIRYWNRGAQKIYGWTAAEAISGDVPLLLNLSDSILQACLAHTIQTGEWSGELERTTKAGLQVTVLSRWTLLRDHAGLPQSVMTVETDISAQKKLESRFLRAQRMEAIGTLAGGIAHDLNNVLAPILLSLQMLQDTQDDNEKRALLATLQTGAQRGSDLIKQVLSFARGVENERFVVNPTHLVRDVLKIIQETFPKNIALDFKPNHDLWTVTGGPSQLHQVIMNLCVNARDAMPKGGKLTVSIQNIVLDEVQAGMFPESKPGGYVLLTVTDTGTGIPMDIQDKIFEPFFTTKEIGRGTGLGLSTTATIVKNHGGFINLHSKPGQGATFNIYLPANTAAQAADSPPIEERQLPRGNGELVLVVDDEEVIRSVMRNTLECFGYRVLLAIHGVEAVALYAQNCDEIAVVITDMAMPVMDGPATILALKTMNPRVKIIGSSGQASSGGLAKAIGSGVQHFLPKPYSAEAMLKALAQILREPVVPT